MLTIGSLFSGIGGLELGLERVGLGLIIWQAESDPYCQRVLEKYWPGVKRYADVRDIDGTAERPDLICGGFPCQPFSVAGRRKGADDERNMWPETIRILRLLRPRFVMLENVPALLAHGYMGRIFGDLAESGFDIWWDCIPAEAVGAPHQRDRLFIVAHANGERSTYDCKSKPGERVAGARAGADSSVSGGGYEKVPNSVGDRLEGIEQAGSASQAAIGGGGGWWATEPNVGRVAHGVPHRVDRLRALGNAVVPQVAEYIGALIVESMEAECP